jgi:hypothetical protein
MKVFKAKLSFAAGAFLFVVACLSCNSKPGENNTSDNTPAQPNTTSKATSMDSLTSISPDAMRDLWQNCTAVDIIFYETNFSLSQDEKASIQNLLGYFLPTPVQHNPQCKPMGRITFIADGEIRQEADIYLSENCTYFIWMKDTRPAHINSMAPQGVAFFNKVISQGGSIQ